MKRKHKIIQRMNIMIELQLFKFFEFEFQKNDPCGFSDIDKFEMKFYHFLFFPLCQIYPEFSDKKNENHWYSNQSEYYWGKKERFFKLSHPLIILIMSGKRCSFCILCSCSPFLLLSCCFLAVSLARICGKKYICRNKCYTFYMTRSYTKIKRTKHRKDPKRRN